MYVWLVDNECLQYNKPCWIAVAEGTVEATGEEAMLLSPQQQQISGTILQKCLQIDGRRETLVIACAIGLGFNQGNRFVSLQMRSVGSLPKRRYLQIAMKLH